MAILNFIGRSKTQGELTIGASPLLDSWSIEVMPRTAAKIEDFNALLPQGTRVYIAHIAGTPVEDMVATAKRLREDGFAVMPHFPARSIPDRPTLEDWIKRYRNDADVTEALLLGGGEVRPAGSLESSIQLLESELFDRNGFTRLHVAGHPEGNKDIDRDGTTSNVDGALKWKNDFANLTDADMAIVTQFGFDPKVIIEWAERVAQAGITLPIHVGIAGPAKLQTLLQFAVSCGVGPSLKVLQKRALDVTRLLSPYEPTDMVAALGDYVASHPNTLISQLHLFPLGGIKPAAEWMNRNATVPRKANIA
ncbi:methylenetetrahydrofolate reductase [Agrobacterium larrymoorei]|uniref:Methylenetetrahydrofolate reductase n=1 Tax=Agrobacterium larrymoorei TaxID=160699 RepID=A0A4D7DRT3_9HYPH|nr:methylenetetrahydrofolate reductase [Agrobacterium larrymoorei]QCI99501.1 methylenetetrahydrofolate reductase [Agrobacterium larrymoorei]QYA09047.1 methylenetetrahydrofolate reductase [Agrobacterium larrymoorei]